MNQQARPIVSGAGEVIFMGSVVFYNFLFAGLHQGGRLSG